MISTLILHCKYHMIKILISFLFLALTTMAHAKESVYLIYAFGAGDSIANYYRTLAKAANSFQDKYVFIFDVKPGAGNSIAANYVKTNPNTILGTSPAFFIRPALFPNESYNIDDFRAFMPQCQSPIAVSSLKFKSWADVPLNGKYTIGVSGLGVATHLVALQVQTKFPNMVIVPYKSTSDAALGLVSGNLDVHVGVISQAEAWNNRERQLNVLGITGKNTSHGYPLLSKQGFPLVLEDMDLATHMVVPKTMPTEKFSELRNILVKAAKEKSVRESYQIDKCVPLSDMTNSQIDTWFQDQNNRYKKLSESVKLEK